MSDYLKKFANYVTEKIDIKKLTKETYVGMDNMIADKGGITKSEYIPQKGTAIAFKKGDILLGNIRPYFKKIWLATFDGGCSQDVLCIRSNGELSSEFIYSLLAQDAFFSYDMSGSKGSKMPRGDKHHIMNFPVPKLNNMNEIGFFIVNINSKIKNNNKIISELEQMAKTIYDYWFLQFEFPNEEGKPYKSSGGKMVWNEELKREIPEIFDVEKIEDVITIKDGTHESPKYIDNGKYLITSKHLDKLGIKFDEANFITEKDFEKINARSKVDKGDILFSMIGALGNVYMIDEDIINFAIKNVALYKTSKKIELGSYIFTTLQSILMKKYIQTTMLGSIQKFIPLGRLRQMPLLYNKNIILKFNEKTKCMFELQSKLKKETMKLTKLRNYLLPLLINGQVGFKETNK